MYAALGISAVVFIVHGVLRYGWVVQNARMSLNWMMLMGTLNPVGAVIHSKRVKPVPACF